MMEDISVFMMDPTHVDFEVYDLWLKGFTGMYGFSLLCCQYAQAVFDSN